MAQSDFPSAAPRDEKLSPNAAPETPRSETPVAAPLKTILVVDDLAAIGNAVTLLLDNKGYRILYVDSGKAALELLGSKSVDGVLVDIEMPGMNGYETCARLHELARATNRPLKIWLITGIDRRDLPADWAKTGALGVLHKPFDWPLLRAELDRALKAPQNPSLPSEKELPGQP